MTTETIIASTSELNPKATMTLVRTCFQAAFVRIADSALRTVQLCGSGANQYSAVTNPGVMGSMTVHHQS